ncbi:MAG: hypothetical protein PHT94_00940 [Candidatus Nanoarchaeia archaeon]|nr:hypothetical protein [Candidatus Nanoarchaeia archaeon]
MNKKVKIAVFLVFLVNFFSYFAGMSYSNEKPVYKLNNNYIAVREDIFNDLVTSQKLLDQYKEDSEYLNKTIEELRKLHQERNIIQDERIDVLKKTVDLKDQIIEYKDMNVNNYKMLYDVKAEEVRKQKQKTLMDKLFTLGLGAFAVSQIDDSSSKTAVGVLTLAIVLK